MARILKICVKCSDRFAATLVEEGKKDVEYDGYVPKFMPEEHFGDYVELDIDIDTGMIINWKKPTKEELKQLNQD